MKTVQETLKSLDRKDLRDEFIERMRNGLFDRELYGYGKMTLNNLKRGKRRFVENFIDELLNITPKKPDNGRIGIIFLFPSTDFWEDDKRHELVFVDELKKHHEKTIGYSYSITDWEEVMGFYVGENKYSQDHIYELMIEIMWEITWHGFTNKDMQNFREDMYKSLDEILGKKETTDNEEEFNDYMRQQPSLEEQLEKLEKFIEKTREDETNSEELFRTADEIYFAYLRQRELKSLINHLPSEFK